MSERWRACRWNHGAPCEHWGPRARRWKEPGAAGLNRRVRAVTETDSQSVTQSPLVLPPAPLWAVASFVPVRHAGN